MNKAWFFVSFYAVLVFLLLHLDSIVAQSVNENEINDRNNNNNNNQSEERNLQRGRGWMENTQQMIASPTGQMVVHMAKELISRSTGNSQVSDYFLKFLLF